MNVKVEGPLSFEQVNTGWRARDGAAVFFFGDVTSELKRLQMEFPGIAFSFLNQVHSDRILTIDRPPNSSAALFNAKDWPEADSQWTRVKGVALCVRTADCVPVLIRAGSSIAAIHAGWRGLESNIIQKTVQVMAAKGADMTKAKAVIGPHIGRTTFEVGRDVAERLTAVFRKLRYNPAPISNKHPDAEKRFVDMSILAQAQLIQGGIDERAVGMVLADTFAERKLHSFRRDKEKAGRQISFIYFDP